MNPLIAFLRGLTARCVIVTAFSTVTVIGAAALAACAVFKIAPAPDVLTNLKELTLMAGATLAGILTPRSEARETAFVTTTQTNETK